MLSDEEREALEILKNFEPDELVECAIYLQALEKITNLIEKQSKEIEELKEERLTLFDTTVKNSIKINDKKWEDKIKAKIEEYKKLINECPMNDEEIFCKECTEKCGFNQTIDVLQSLLEKE